MLYCMLELFWFLLFVVKKNLYKFVIDNLMELKDIKELRQEYLGKL